MLEFSPLAFLLLLEEMLLNNLQKLILRSTRINTTKCCLPLCGAVHQRQGHLIHHHSSGPEKCITNKDRSQIYSSHACRSLHTTSLQFSNLSDNYREPVVFRWPLYQISLWYLSKFTRSVDFNEGSFITGATEAALFVCDKLSTGDSDDLEDMLTVKGSEDLKILLDRSPEDFRLNEDEDLFMNLFLIRLVKREVQDHLAVTMTLLRGDSVGARERGGRLRDTDPRLITFEFIVYVNKDYIYESDWLINRVEFARPFPAE